jgi:hypothetical protein
MHPNDYARSIQIIPVRSRPMYVKMEEHVWPPMWMFHKRRVYAVMNTQDLDVKV